MAYDNSNSGFIGKNERKTEDKHPDLSGSCEVGGVQYWIKGWRNSKGYGLRFTPKEESTKQPARQTPSVDEDIPFAPVGKHG